jgi:hypothetical protein
MLYRLFDVRNESRNVFVEFERESIVYAVTINRKEKKLLKVL